MNRDETWRVIAEQRRVLADVLSRLDAEQWARPSLCAQVPDQGCGVVRGDHRLDVD